MSDQNYENNDSFEYYSDGYDALSENASENADDNYVDAYDDRKKDEKQGFGIKNRGPLATAISIVFLIWFLGSVVAMVYLSRIGESALAVTCFGQVFVIMGIIAIISTIKSHTFQPFILLFPLVGAGCIYFSLTYYFYPESREDMFDLMPYGMMILFFATGLFIMLTGIFGSSSLKKKCTFSIQGKVVKLDSKNDDGTTTYCPTYEIYFRGDYHRLRKNLYTNVSVPKIGDSIELLINPDNPEEFYCPSQNKSVSIFLILFGLFFMVISALLFFAMTLAA